MIYYLCYIDISTKVKVKDNNLMNIDNYIYISVSVFLVSIYYYAYYLDLTKRTRYIAKKRNKKSAYRFLFLMLISSISTVALYLVK